MLNYVAVLCVLGMMLGAGCSRKEGTPGDFWITDVSSSALGKTTVRYTMKGYVIDQSGQAQGPRTILTVRLELPTELTYLGENVGGGNQDDVWVYKHQVSFSVAESENSYQVDRKIGGELILDGRANVLRVEGDEYDISQIPAQLTVRLSESGELEVVEE